MISVGQQIGVSNSDLNCDANWRPKAKGF